MSQTNPINEPEGTSRPLQSVARLSGKVALVTGAGNGIGRATARAFAREGARVVVSDIRKEAAEETAHLLSSNGGEAIVIPADVSSSHEVAHLIEQTLKAFGRLDCAFNNAGIPPRLQPFKDVTEEEWDMMMAVGLKGVWLCMKYELAFMVEHGGGVIINSGSSVSLRGAPFMSHYAAAKHGVAGLTRSAALEYARNNIRVNAVAPFFTNTSFLNTVPESVLEQAKMVNPAGRFAEPGEIAEFVVWLCSDAATYMNGQLLPIDGGRTAG